MSENPTNRERSRHVDVRVHFLRDMVRDGAVKLIKCAGTQNVADALTKSLPKPAFHKHREFLHGTDQSLCDAAADHRVLETPAMHSIRCLRKHVFFMFTFSPHQSSSRTGLINQLLCLSFFHFMNYSNHLPSSS